MNRPRLYILGMAKSALDLRGAKARSLRLDVEFLASAIEELQSQGHRAVGYVLVLTPVVAHRVETWCRELGLQMLVGDLPAEVMDAIQEEKQRNARGISSGTREDSIANVSREAAEDDLRRQIEQLHPGVSACGERSPRGVHWDFFGVV